MLALDAATSASEPARQVAAWLTDGPVQGVYWLPLLMLSPSWKRWTCPGWRRSHQVAGRNGSLAVMRALPATADGPGAFLVSATRLGGLHGYGPEGATAPMGGAVTGFTKAYKRERPGALVKAIDFAIDDGDPAAVADALIAETLADPGAVEIGQSRWQALCDHRGRATGGRWPVGHGPRERDRLPGHRRCRRHHQRDRG